MSNFDRALAAGAALVLMLAMLGHPPVHRTQEARVLQTAREMLGPSGDRIIPHLNGQIRLEKPPLAYWLAASAFKIGGVSEGVGRVPFALAGWLTLIVTYFAGRWIGGERMGIVSASFLLGMWMFARHARYAETDILATLFVTSATFCIWRGWHRTSGVMIGAAMMAKGLPAAFPLVFLITFALATRDHRLIWRWIKSGAPLILLAIGTPWFIYAGRSAGFDKFATETHRGLVGFQHADSMFQYFPELLLGMLPWTFAAVIATVVALPRWRSDNHARGMILWFASIFIPLLLAGQRQFHYLLPALPPLALLTGWLIEVAAHDAKVTNVLLLGTRRPVLLAGIFAIATTIIAQVIVPSLRQTSSRAVAAEIKSIGPGPYCFYGPNISLPLLFYLGEPIQQLETQAQLQEHLAQTPEFIVIAQTKSNHAPPPAPPGLMEVRVIDVDEQKFQIYRSAPSD